MDWHLVYTAPSAEWVAADALLRRGYSIFEPAYRHELRLRKKRVVRHMPVFPSYLFVCDPQGRGDFAAIEAAPSIVEIVRLDGHPVVIAADVVDWIALAAESGCFLRGDDADEGSLRYVESLPYELPCEYLARFRVGAQVRVRGGVFAGIMGTIAAAPARERIKLLLNVFGGSKRVDLPFNLVETLT